MDGLFGATICASNCIITLATEELIIYHFNMGGNMTNGKVERLKDFGFALQELKLGGKLTRSGWNGKGMWIELQNPTETSKMTRPYIFMCLPKGSTNQFGDSAKDLDMIPWLASQTDLLATDWELVQ